MIMSLILFEEFLNIVSISFTALILNELIMVALEITIWYDAFRTFDGGLPPDSRESSRHVYMVIAEIVTLLLYGVSIVFLPGQLTARFDHRDFPDSDRRRVCS